MLGFVEVEVSVRAGVGLRLVEVWVEAEVKAENGILLT